MLVVLGVYAAAVYTFIRGNSSESLDERLHDDFDWASDMLAQRPDGSIAPYEETGEGDSPWLQVYNLSGQLLYETPEARRNPVPESGKHAAKADERIVSGPNRSPPLRLMHVCARSSRKP